MSSKVFSVVVSSFRSESRARSPFPSARRVLPAVALLLLGACGGIADDADPDTDTAEQLLQGGKHRPNGEQLFETAFPATNGRSLRQRARRVASQP